MPVIVGRRHPRIDARVLKWSGSNAEIHLGRIITEKEATRHREEREKEIDFESWARRGNAG
jgi:hypothetical protein